MSSLMQLTAFIIVIAGTIGAVMVSSSEKDLKTGIALAKKAFFNEKSDVQKNINEIVDCARIAKKETLLAVEPRLIRIQDPFLKKILRNVVDGTDPQSIREIFETEIEVEEEELLAGAKIWTDAGGYAPTIGIIGAVLGLIHVMGNLTDTSKLGGGIAVAFVATVYGVSSANLLFLPMGSKLKKRVQKYSREKQMILEGALMIAASAQPFVIEQKMQAFVPVETEATGA